MATRTESTALSALGLTGMCDLSASMPYQRMGIAGSLGLALYQIAHIQMRTRHGLYLVKRHGARMGTVAMVARTVSLKVAR